MKDAIVVDSLSFSYQGSRVLKDISFTVLEGELIGIIGPNGGGKTTLLSLLMGFLRPEKGTIRVLGKPPKEARTDIAWVPQTFHFDRQFPISVLEVVLAGRLQYANFWGRYRKEDQKAAQAALEKMEMLSYSHARFSELSGGQIQRVLIARALASEPKILFLDEPTASVDVTVQREIYKLLHLLKGSMTILMVTHDLKATIEHAERVFCVQKELSLLSKDALCKHFALGLYHPPVKLSKTTTEVDL